MQEVQSASAFPASFSITSWKKWDEGMWNRYKGNSSYRTFADSLSLLNACWATLSDLYLQSSAQTIQTHNLGQLWIAGAAPVPETQHPNWKLRRPNLYWNYELQPQRLPKRFNNGIFVNACHKHYLWWPALSVRNALKSVEDCSVLHPLHCGYTKLRRVSQGLFFTRTFFQAHCTRQHLCWQTCLWELHWKVDVSGSSSKKSQNQNC